MTILAERVDVVIGVDTHTDTHTAALLTAAGAIVADLTVGRRAGRGQAAGLGRGPRRRTCVGSGSSTAPGRTESA